MTKLVWCDLETTGLNDTDLILAIAIVITDQDLNVLAESPVVCIKTPKEILDKMDPWCIEQHGFSGLTLSCLNSTVTMGEAEEQMLNFLVDNGVVPKTSPLCGNSVHNDRRWLKFNMPTLHDAFHYRNLDVSTIKILAQHWAPDIASSVIKNRSHTPLEDIHESIQELIQYRDSGFIG